MLERYRVVNTHDIGEYLANARRVHPDVQSITPAEVKPFGGTVSCFRFGAGKERSVLEAVSSTVSFRAEHEATDDVRVLIPTTASVEARCGKQMRELAGDGSIGLLPSSGMSAQVTAGHAMMLRVSARRVAAALREFDFDGAIGPVLNSVFFDAHVAGLHDLSTHIAYVVASIDHESDLIVDRRSFRAAHDELIVLRLAEILANLARSARRQSVERSGGRLRRALSYIKDHADEPIELTALARHCGASLRSLQLMFRRDLDSTITRHILEQRLAVARGRLQCARPEETVSAIARRSGFVHLGEFARAYAEAFCEPQRHAAPRPPPDAAHGGLTSARRRSGAPAGSTPLCIIRFDPACRRGRKRTFYRFRNAKRVDCPRQNPAAPFPRRRGVEPDKRLFAAQLRVTL